MQNIMQRPQDELLRRVISVNKAARKIGVDVRTLLASGRRGAFPIVKIGSTSYVIEEELAKFLNQAAVAA